MDRFSDLHLPNKPVKAERATTIIAFVLVVALAIGTISSVVEYAKLQDRYIDILHRYETLLSEEISRRKDYIKLAVECKS